MVYRACLSACPHSRTMKLQREKREILPHHLPCQISVAYSHHIISSILLFPRNEKMRQWSGIPIPPSPSRAPPLTHPINPQIQPPHPPLSNNACINPQRLFGRIASALEAFAHLLFSLLSRWDLDEDGGV